MALPFPHVEGISHSFVDAGGLRMHVAEAGEGEPLVLLHGWPQHWYLWRHVIGPLSERFRVICPDLRGLGWTDAPASGYDKETMASDVLALLDALELPRVRLMGHDWGGWCGFLLGLSAPERIERFVALNIAHPWGVGPSLDGALGLWRLWYQAVVAAPSLGAWVLRSRPELVRRAIAGESERGRPWSEEELQAFYEVLREPHRARASTRIYRSFLLRELPAVAAGRYRGRRLTVPTLLVFGTGDGVLRRSMVEGFEPHADDMRLELVDGCGHFIVDECPEVVLEHALPFLGAARRPG
jgi:pimeloyl-ACP methyl ester carboxylesterase